MRKRKQNKINKIGKTISESAQWDEIKLAMLDFITCYIYCPMRWNKTCNVRLYNLLHLSLQYLTKYLRITLVFMWNSAPGKILISVFQEFCASVNKTFILTGDLNT